MRRPRAPRARCNTGSNSSPALGFSYDTGLYLQFRATGADDFHLAQAAAMATRVGSPAPPLSSPRSPHADPADEARWVTTAINYRARRWNDVVKLLTPIVNDPDLDEFYAHAAKIAARNRAGPVGDVRAGAVLPRRTGGPVAVAAVDGALAKALALRAHGDNEAAADTLQDLYAANPENAQVEQALSTRVRDRAHLCGAHRGADRSVGRRHRTHDDDFVDPGAHERKAVLLAEAEQQLGEFIGLDEVKNQVSRLKSSVAMALLRQQRGLTVAQRTHHLVFAGPPGTGKTTIARVVAKIYCGLGLLKKENVKEVHRADMIGQHIGETEAKTNAIIDGALDGVLFLDEAYALVATGAKNDFGLVAIDTLLARMENDRDRLVVIIAGYRADLDRSWTPTRDCGRDSPAASTSPPTPPGSWSRSPMPWPPARQRLRAVRARRPAAAVRPPGRRTMPDTNGVSRRSLDIAGNGRFVRNVVERSEEEREFRLDHWKAGCRRTSPTRN